jgi:hypothetical protein
MLTENRPNRIDLMKRRCEIICLLSIAVMIAVFAACKKADSSQPGILGFGDETAEAVSLVNEANIQLKAVKVMYKNSQDQQLDLKTAMAEKDVEKVKKLSDDFVTQLNEGMNLGEEAIKKIEEAQEKRTNPKYQEYLALKEQSLRKYLAAFEFRRKLAIRLRDVFTVSKDKNLIEKAKDELKVMEDNFQTNIDEAQRISRDANDLAKKQS